MINWYGAMAYAKWFAQKTRLPWRLASEFEWEKSARGVDGRFFPWGDGFDPSWCHMRESQSGQPYPAVVDSYPVDCSPYGVRGMSGNMRDWTLSPMDGKIVKEDHGRILHFDPSSLLPPSSARGKYHLRGGMWTAPSKSARIAQRYFHPPMHRDGNIGFRLVRHLPF